MLNEKKCSVMGKIRKEVKEMSKGRYDVRQRDTFIDMIPIPTTHTVVITDRATGKEYHGSSTTVEHAEERAWEEVRKDNSR